MSWREFNFGYLSGIHFVCRYIPVSADYVSNFIEHKRVSWLVIQQQYSTTTQESESELLPTEKDP